MSHEATNWAFKQRGLKPSAKIVLLALADRHNPDHGCFPSKKTLAEDCEMSERAVYDQIKLLVERGLVHVSDAPVAVRGQFQSNRYYLSFEADFPRQISPSANSAVGKLEQSPSAKSAGDRRQNLPTNPVREPRKRTSNLGDALVPPKPKTRRAVAIPDDWAPSDKNISDAKSRNFSDEEIDVEAAAFRDHHLARGTAFKDWDAAWRTWLGNARKFGRVAAPSHARNRSAHDGLFAGFQRAAGRG